MNPRNLLTLSCRIPAPAGLAGIRLAGIMLAGIAVGGLAGCASSGARNWAKAGVSDSQRSADYSQCRSEMRAATRQSDNIDQDISSSLGSDWRKLGQYHSQQSQLAGSDSDNAAQILSSCMTDKGYRPL